MVSYSLCFSSYSNRQHCHHARYQPILLMLITLPPFCCFLPPFCKQRIRTAHAQNKCSSLTINTSTFKLSLESSECVTTHEKLSTTSKAPKHFSLWKSTKLKRDYIQVTEGLENFDFRRCCALL